MHERGHDGPHKCDCRKCPEHDERSLDRYGCVAKPPYYGEHTNFYGEDTDAG